MININSKRRSSWLLREEYPADLVKRKLSILSSRVRQEQYGKFTKYLKPSKTDKVIDVGVSSFETLPEINFFERYYPYPHQLTAASIDEPLNFSKKYPKIKYVQIKAGERLPFADKSFDIVVSWATVEHVGSKEQQRFFLNELFRIGEKVFVTTPYRACFYEPHSELFFIHWLPRPLFHFICRLLKKKFWADANNLRCLGISDLREILPKIKGIKIIVYKTLGFIPSHLMIVSSS